MAIKQSFGGAGIYKPGAYSKFKVDNSSGSPLDPSDVLFVIGESSIGAPGASEGIQSFDASQLQNLVAKYGSGPIVDAAVAAVRPSKTPGVGGAGRILVWKTNASTQASADLKKSSNTMLTVKDVAWGLPGNALSVVVAAGDSGSQKHITVPMLGGTTEDLGENPALPVISIHYTGDASTAVVSIAGISRAALTLTTTLAGDQTDGSVNLSIALANKTIKQLVDAINAQTGYSASIQTVSLSQNPANDLDPVSSVSIASSLNLMRLQKEMLELLNTSARIQATEATQPLGGVLDNQTKALSGGAQGASTNTNFSNGLAASMAVDYVVVVPAVSRDASTDIADPALGFTDPSSTYTIASVIAATSSHLALRAQIKGRKEAQGMCGFRNSSKATCFSTIAAIADANIQCTMQDAVFSNAAGDLAVGQPHVLAAMCAGIRLGTAVGEPLTFKVVNALQVGHIIDPNTLLQSGDFNPLTDVDSAIAAGVLFTEPFNAANRVVVDNTTYGYDDSFVFNRGSVLEASYYTFKQLRETAENLFVGKKVSNGLADSIKNAIRNKLRELNQPDVQIITSSDNAPDGFREDTFTVTITGNTCYVAVEFIPVQGLDFVFFDFTLGDIQQTAA